MPRFTDEWLFERVLYDFATGGGASACACCRLVDDEANAPSLVWFGGWKSLLSAIPDLPDSAQDLAWPQLDSVWADRVKIRHKLVLRQKAKTAVDFLAWLESTRLVPPNEEKKSAKSPPYMVIPREDFLEWITIEFGIHTIYSHIVFVAMEQVTHFQLTKYPPDASCTEDDGMERAWEDCLYWEKESLVVLLHPAIVSRYRVVDSEPSSSWFKGESASPTSSDRRLVRLLLIIYVVEKLRMEYDAELQNGQIGNAEREDE